MKILMLTDRFPPEVRSSAHLFHDLARMLQTRGHEVRVITKAPSKYTAQEANSDPRKSQDGWDLVEGVQVRRVRWIPFLDGSLGVRALDHLTLWLPFAWAGRQWPRADIVLIYSPPLPLALAGGAYQWWYRTPFVLNVQDLYPQTAIDLGLLRNRVGIRAAEHLEMTAYLLAEGIVVHSEGNQKFLVDRKRVLRAKVRVIQNWVDLAKVRPGPRENGFRQKQGLAGRFVVSFAGLMGYAQDLTTTIEAAELLQDRPDILFLLVGEGVAESRWKALAAKKRLSNVRFLPMQPKGSYAQLLTASDVCLVPLANELRTPVVPGKLQSIMASGRLVIATLNLGGDTSRIIESARCGYAFEPGNARQVAETILRLYHSPALAEQLGANGRAYAEQHFSLSECCSAYERLFEEVLEGRRRKSA